MPSHIQYAQYFGFIASADFERDPWVADICECGIQDLVGLHPHSEDIETSDQKFLRAPTDPRESLCYSTILHAKGISPYIFPMHIQSRPQKC